MRRRLPVACVCCLNSSVLQPVLHCIDTPQGRMDKVVGISGLGMSFLRLLHVL
ncbi:hypothetical protein BKA93DRAFT_785047 [Sparassis latifolia]